MIKSPKWAVGYSRRTFLKAATGVTAGTVLTRQPLLAQSNRASAGVSRLGRAACPRPAREPLNLSGGKPPFPTMSFWFLSVSVSNKEAR